MATEFLEDKINHLKQQLKQDKVNVFVHDLAIEDAIDSSGNGTVDEQLKVTAASNQMAKTMLVRRIQVRDAKLKELEVEFEATKTVVRQS